MRHLLTATFTSLCTVSAALAGSLAFQVGTAVDAHADEWREAQYWLEEYGFTSAWETTRGHGAVVAVIDTGVDKTHPDLLQQVTGGTDVSGLGNADGTKPLGEDSQHGTMVGSLIAGHGNNAQDIVDAREFNAELEERARAAEKDSDDDADSSDTDDEPSDGPTPRDVPEPGPGDEGILGTAPEATLLSISVHLGEEAELTPEEQIPRAVRWAVDQGADVINISLSSSAPDWPTSWDDAFLYAEQNDVIVVAAAGNRGSGTMSVGAPATIPGVLTVAGLEKDGTASWDSSTEGITIGVAAPADPLVGAVPGPGYARWSGTSGAAPLVAGLAALIRSEHPDMPAHQVIHRILYTAEDAGQSGVDPVYGHGIINADAALHADVPTVDRNPMDTISEWIRIHRRAEVEEPGDDETGQADQRPVPTTEVPTALPQASEYQHPRQSVQPLVVLGTLGVAFILALSALVTWLIRRRRHGAR